jgi:drug/metabolite transporter (DMT)-like permease
VVIVLGLFAALAYGLSDFIGGLVTRRVPVWQVALLAQITATLLAAAAVPLFSNRLTVTSVAWGVVAGIAAGAANVAIYAGLGGGRMGVVAPLSGIGAAVVPVLAGVLGGERPSSLAWMGVVLALPAIWLVAAGASTPAPTTGHRGRHADVALGLLAGLGFGGQFAALGQIPVSAGVAPVAISGLTSVVVIAAAATLAGASVVPRARGAAGGAVAGALAGVATLTFLLAAQAGELTVAGVLTALYPAITVLLAWLVLGERIRPVQGFGLLLAAAAVVLVSVG